MDQGQGTEDGVTEPGGPGLDDKREIHRAQAGSVVFENVRLARGNHKTNLRGSRAHHALDEVLAHRARPFDAALETAADGQEFLGKGERLDSAARAGRR